MNWLQIVQLLAEFDMKEIQALIKEVKDVAIAIDKLKEPGNDRADTVTLMREIAQALNSAADVLDPKN